MNKVNNTSKQNAPIEVAPKPVTAYWLPEDWAYVRAQARLRGLKMWALLSEMVELYRAAENELKQ